MSIIAKNMDIMTVHPKLTYGIDFIIDIVMERTLIGMIN
jgi:hypothetical protein